VTRGEIIVIIIIIIIIIIVVVSKYFTGNCTHNFVPLIFAAESCADNICFEQTALFYPKLMTDFGSSAKSEDSHRILTELNLIKPQ
jgi:hypothetical protein